MRIWSALPARVRLTLGYGLLSLLSGIALGVLVWIVAVPRPGAKEVSRPIVSSAKRETSDRVATESPKQLLAKISETKARAYHDLQMRMLTASGLMAGAMTALALGTGWIMAGRVLRPVRAVSQTARDLSENDLHQRLPVTGPDDELRELAQTFNTMLSRLERAFAGQRLFTANASHELRGPVTTQRALLEVTLANPEAHPETLALARNLHHVTQRQERLITGLFELASSQHGPRRRARIPLHALVTDLLGRWEPVAASNGLVATRDIEPVVVDGDPVLVEIMIDNLLRNAITHNREGGRLHLDLARGALSIANTGPPLTGQRLAELTQPFRRGARDRVGDTPGSGLGLAIIHTIAQAHGAGLDLVALPEGGLRATVTFGPAQPETAGRSIRAPAGRSI